MSLGSRSVKRAASQALADFTADDIYPPGWVTSIGKPTPGRAWRQYDVFGENEVVAVTFSYSGAEHALLVAIDLTELPTVSMIAHGDNPDGMLKTLQDQAEPGSALRRSRWPRPGRALPDRSPGLATIRTTSLTNPRSCSCRSPAPASGDFHQPIQDRPSRTRPPTGPPPSRSSSAALRPAGSVIRMSRDSGRRC